MSLATKRNILFIINPISGGKSKLKIPALIDQFLDKALFNPNYTYTEYAGHGAELAEEAANKNFDIIVAVGGDGTINEIATKVVRCGKILAIIPLGSGNGLARFLKIPMDPSKAIELINKSQVLTIDAAVMNKKYFFNMAGVGFDAQISSVFAGNKGRGLKGYIEMGLSEVTTYKAKNYRLEIDGEVYQREAFAISIANSSQYGNNVYISPESSITDGVLEVCIIKAFPMVKLPILAFQMLRGSTHQSDLVEIIKARTIKILRDAEAPVHVDGEPYVMGSVIDVQVLPAVLNVITKS